MAVAQGPSGGFLGILKNLIVFIISYGYIPFQWYLNKSTKKPVLDISCNQIKVKPKAIIHEYKKRIKLFEMDCFISMAQPFRFSRTKLWF